MPSTDAQKTGLFCKQCGEDKQASELQVLFAQYVVDGKFERVGRYCLTCIPNEKIAEREIRQAINFKTEPFSPAVKQERAL